MKHLKSLRKSRNLSQQKLADILHISQQSVYKYENDITSPDIETLKRMADYFNTSIDYILEYTDISHKIEPVSLYDLNPDEASLINNYRLLSHHQKSTVRQVAESYLLPDMNEIK